MPPGQSPTTKTPFFGVKVSKPGVPIEQATNKQLVYSNNYSTTTYYDANNSRILIGLLPDGTYGIVISKPGIDVTSVFQ